MRSWCSKAKAEGRKQREKAGGRERNRKGGGRKSRTSTSPRASVGPLCLVGEGDMQQGTERIALRLMMGDTLCLCPPPVNATGRPSGEGTRCGAPQSERQQAPGAEHAPHRDGR